MLMVLRAIGVGLLLALAAWIGLALLSTPLSWMGIDLFVKVHLRGEERWMTTDLGLWVHILLVPSAFFIGLADSIKWQVIHAREKRERELKTSIREEILREIDTGKQPGGRG